MGRNRVKPMPQSVKNFGIKIKELRQQRNMSQMDVGAALGIDRENIRKYEKGIQEPRLSIVIKFAAVFNVSFNELFDFIKEK
ncbi:hypothetical protein ATO12_23595 [Aquimarina atlantica]|uniref:HTH cro/C1-type domain-containing protein n=1 Tax=Aquimarina atlantica TaxID=1317122 RepID=A0A023BR23_9FLAO|nr:helix-turn-helix transcriptional regulator [Aquimarina atlantica]EZH72436.1 hypothetical protein ATO12_23595 [Aquimarina atlantica]